MTRRLRALCLAWGTLSLVAAMYWRGEDRDGVSAALSPVLAVDYVLVGQRPDTAGALHAPYTTEFSACCAAYSASTVGVYHPTPPVAWVQFQVTLTATTKRDAVRLRIVNSGTSRTVVSADQAPLLVLAPRTVGYWLDAAEWNSRASEHQYVLETRGAPVIYGAKLRVGYQGAP